KWFRAIGIEGQRPHPGPHAWPSGPLTGPAFLSLKGREGPWQRGRLLLPAAPSAAVGIELEALRIEDEAQSAVLAVLVDVEPDDHRLVERLRCTSGDEG